MFPRRSSMLLIFRKCSSACAGWIAINWSEMWSHRELLGFLICGYISIRYKQTILGPAWAVFQPMMMMGIFTVIFGRFAKIDSLGLPIRFSYSPV